MKRLASSVCRLRRLRDDEGGVVAPAVAVLAISLLGAAGLALDVGLYYLGNADLRSATEAAALSAAVDPAQARQRATDYLVRNGYPASVLKTWQVGYYCANIDPRYPAGSRFVTASNLADCPGSSAQNAVRLTTGKPSRHFLTGVIGMSGAIPDLTATASAARIDEAGITITSGLLTVTNTLLNSVNDLLGTLLGIKLRLSTADVEALMGGNVDAGKFFDALASRTGRTGTYSQLMQGTYGMQDITLAAADAAYNPATAAALRTIGGVAGNAYKVPFTQNGVPLFGLGVWKNMPVGGSSVRPALRAGLNAYQLVTYTAQAGPGVIDASKLVSLAAPNSTVQVKAVASGLPDRPRFAFGPAGEIRVGTSMLRLQLDVELVNLGIPGILDARAHVPLVLDVAAAEAEIAGGGIECAGQAEQKGQTLVRINTKSGLVNGYVGELVSPGKVSKQMPTLQDSDFKNADFFKLSLVGIPLATLQGKVIVKPVVGASNSVAIFGRGGPAVIGAPEAAGTGVVVGNRGMVGSTVSALSNSLLASNSLRACAVGSLLCVNPDTAALANLKTVLDRTGSLLGNVADPLLDNVLAALGIELGHATVWTTGVRCGVPVLI